MLWSDPDNIKYADKFQRKKGKEAEAEAKMGVVKQFYKATLPELDGTAQEEQARGLVMIKVVEREGKGRGGEGRGGESKT